MVMCFSVMFLCYVFVCLPCTSPEIEITQVKHKDHSHRQVLKYIDYIAMSGTLSK